MKSWMDWGLLDWLAIMWSDLKLKIKKQRLCSSKRLINWARIKNPSWNWRNLSRNKKGMFVNYVCNNCSWRDMKLGWWTTVYIVRDRAVHIHTDIQTYMNECVNMWAVTHREVCKPRRMNVDAPLRVRAWRPCLDVQ